jgi:hypothetical protein
MPKSNIEKSIQGLTSLFYNVFGKANVANIISKLTHIATVTLLSNTFLKWAKSSVFRFIWNKMERVQRSAAINPFTARGLGIFKSPLDVMLEKVDE